MYNVLEIKIGAINCRQYIVLNIDKNDETKQVLRIDSKGWKDQTNLKY